DDAVSLRLRSGILEQTGATVDVLQSDTMDHYRTFYMLERLLHSPPKYYAFNDAFVREVLGKKLSKGTKKDLDDISAKTGVTLKSCRRQTRDYAAIVFFANSRFETGKKKLQYLSFEDFAYCAEQMIENWTLGAMEFLQGLKELKVLIADKDLLDLHKSLVCTALRGKISVFSEMEANFKVGPAGAQVQSLNPDTPPFAPTISLLFCGALSVRQMEL
ncbi:hypothetical protein Chor_014804, partial [Crotalus horridus]